MENADSFTLLRNPVPGKEKREMGNLLSFVRSLGDKSVSEIDDKFKLFIDFEKDKIENEGEQKVHDLSVKVDGKIGESSEALKFLANYGPGAYLLRYLLLIVSFIVIAIVRRKFCQEAHS